MDPFWTTFTLILFTEIADKSRVVGLILAATYKSPWPVFFGMTMGYAVLEGIAVMLGGTAYSLIPLPWISKGVGAIFISVGAAAIFFGEEAETGAQKLIGRFKRWGPFLIAFLATSISEIADRTQIATAALSARTGRPWEVYAGALGALTGLNALTVMAGDKISGRFSVKAVHRFAGACFVAVGCAVLFGI